MAKANFHFSSESVTEGHPDKVCDQVSDGVLDACLAQDPLSRVACETATKTGRVILLGEITTKASLDLETIARDTLRRIGYTRPEYGIGADECEVQVYLDPQSPDIAQGVDKAQEADGGDEFDRDGAGDQGLMFGYATDENEAFMPMPIALAHGLCRRLAEVRHDGTLGYLRPDGKSQVSIRYEKGSPVEATTILIAAQHHDGDAAKTIQTDIIETVIRPVVPAYLISKNTRFLVNSTGKFVIGGPQGDAGLTGRKIIVDTYGGWARHGGGAFSGKDPSKVDRSAAYAARHVAKNVVAAGLAQKCELQVAYAIGVAKPLSVMVETFGSNAVPEATIEKLIDKYFDLRPAAIIKRLNLRRPIYQQTAAYGHFGRTDLDLPWERTDLAETLRQEAGLKAPAHAIA